MTLEEALNVISENLYSSYEELKSGLPGGTLADWNYDERLVVEIAEAVVRWKSRQRTIQDPYVVWFFDGLDWKKVSKEMYQEDAYREWYRLTGGGRKQNDSKCETYFYLGSADETLEGRHPVEEEEDDFSVNYLLNKSFGE